MKSFDIPVALFIFKRDKAVRIIERIAEVRPKKLYLLADYGRNEQECALADACRTAVEQAITWDCEVIKNYATENRGVYENIAGGAKWVLRQEKWAIFLEDDNLPETTFFPFCEEMLRRYEHDTRVLWICGTNYLGEYTPENGNSYVFTRHMLPCGWASWSHKFETFYDGEMSLYENEDVQKNIGDVYYSKALYEQCKASWTGEYYRISHKKKPLSWDYQMDFSIKANNLFGICPCKNQIENIGVDVHSAHFGSSFSDIMVRRFCGMKSYPITFPLKHPATVMSDKVFEKKIAKIILYPLKRRIVRKVMRTIRAWFRIPYEVSTKDFFLRRKKGDNDSN